MTSNHRGMPLTGFSRLALARRGSLAGEPVSAKKQTVLHADERTIHLLFEPLSRLPGLFWKAHRHLRIREYVSLRRPVRLPQAFC